MSEDVKLRSLCSDPEMVLHISFIPGPYAVDKGLLILVCHASFSLAHWQLSGALTCSTPNISLQYYRWRKTSNLFKWNPSAGSNEQSTGNQKIRSISYV
ncbi:hypothetical protein GDO78_009048 [Eleutherodactylus coqui]|uniref:Uncharacterized protein n=1 Tax=Eleutherodactylus coqui TaxID=57060 RepID=A0A8J6F912_ELECQ|nr:hypothetical protein GDO78_009048 [Eleutherodactylus coqui]